MELTLPGEKDNKRTGLVVTIAIHLLLLIIFFFAVVWREQFPPTGKVGIPGVMVDFGNSNTGKGEVKNREKEVATEEPVEEVTEVAAKPAESAVAETPMENPHKVKVSQETTPAPVKSPKPEAEKPAENPIDQSLLYKKPSSEGNDKSGKNKGKENGKESNEYEGMDEGEGGSNGLNELGWGWHVKPENPDSDDMGYIIVKFTVDDAGRFLSVSLSGTARPLTQAYFKEQLLKIGKLKRTGEHVQNQGTFKIDLSKH